MPREIDAVGRLVHCRTSRQSTLTAPRFGRKIGSGACPSRSWLVRQRPARTHKRMDTEMASTGKKKTTMAKLARESRLRERRLDKEARKRARKLAAAHPAAQPNDASTASQEQPGA